jgi:hypothetical protein
MQGSQNRSAELAGVLRALRRKVLTPNASATKLEVRGFNVKNAASKELLETVGGIFLTGFGEAVEASTPAAAEEPLEKIPEQFRGFAYEGAGMGFALLDGLPGGGGGRVDQFLAGRGDAHNYMVYVGVGWAMARLPRFRWPRPEGLDPMLRWLALDGYGFHQAYFRTRRYIDEQYQDKDFSWPDRVCYANSAIDQGIGRAMWFIAGTDPQVCAAMIDKFVEPRRADLYSGAGLAATYAGGVTEDELRQLWELAGTYRPQVAQGSAFAAEARVRAELVVPHTHLATQVLCGMTPQRAAQVCIATRPDAAGPDPDGDQPLYEIWRQRIAGEFVSLGRC